MQTIVKSHISTKLLVRNKNNYRYKYRCLKPELIVDDYNDNTMYLYYIGRCNNEPIYHYGTTLDLSLVDINLMSFKIKKYIKIRTDVLSHHVYAKEHFTTRIKELKLDRYTEIDGALLENSQTNT